MKLRKYLSRILRPSVGISNESLREQWLEKALKSIPDGSKILDAGAGTQRYRRFCKHLEYISQDFGQYDGKGDTTGLQTGEFHYGKLDIVSDITSIPMPDASFDAIMCIEVFEHLPNPILALTEFFPPAETWRLPHYYCALLFVDSFCTLPFQHRLQQILV